MSGALRSNGGVRRAAVFAALLLITACGVLAVLLWRELDAAPDTGAPGGAADPALVERGAYLARIGNCQGCHDGPDGAAYAGGRGIDTPFGRVIASNLTPDPATGLGAWSNQAFWRAMHEGRSRDGRLLYPVFPYPNTTHVTRADSDALLAYLRSLAPVARPNGRHALRFPYNTQAALATWRLLYFRPADGAEPDTLASASPRSAAWQRGAYLVRGLGHCSACHAARNALGATGDALQLDGGVMPVQNWYAPSLRSPHEAGMGDWDLADIAALLTTGISPRGSVQGPMAEVVAGSTQHLNAADAAAMAEFLKDLPGNNAGTATGPAPRSEDIADTTAQRGGELYRTHCADCHGKQGEGVPGAYPALAGNRAVTMANAVNLVQVISHGGFAPATAGNPRPYGMPPFGLVLDHGEIAAITTYLRSAWGHRAAAVSSLEVQRWRGGKP